MTDGNGQPPQAGGAQPQAGTEPTQPQAGEPKPQAGSEPAPSSGPNDVTTLQRELAATRREAAGYRTKLKSYEDRDKTDAQKQTERIAELESALTTEQKARQGDRLQMTILGTARKLGFRNPEIAHRLLSSAEVEFDATGTPKNVDALLAAIAKSDPYLVGGGSSDSGLGPRGTPPSAGTDMNTAIRRGLGRA
jgi:hypothetical protein